MVVQVPEVVPPSAYKQLQLRRMRQQQIRKGKTRKLHQQIEIFLKNDFKTHWVVLRMASRRQHRAVVVAERVRQLSKKTKIEKKMNNQQFACKISNFIKIKNKY